MLQIFRDDSLPPDVLCFLATDGDDTALIYNGALAATEAQPTVLSAMNALLAERHVGTSPLQAVG